MPSIEASVNVLCLDHDPIIFHDLEDGMSRSTVKTVTSARPHFSRFVRHQLFSTRGQRGSWVVVRMQ